MTSSARLKRSGAVRPRAKVHGLAVSSFLRREPAVRAGARNGSAAPGRRPVSPSVPTSPLQVLFGSRRPRVGGGDPAIRPWAAALRLTAGAARPPALGWKARPAPIESRRLSQSGCFSAPVSALMTHPALTSVSPARWPTSPSTGEVRPQLDPCFGETEVVRALNERLHESSAREPEEAIVSGDRPRYENRGNAVRPPYRHSTSRARRAATSGFLTSAHAGDAERAIRFGLRGGRRRFLHGLTSTTPASRRRAGRECAVLRIFALDAWEGSIPTTARRCLLSTCRRSSGSSDSQRRTGRPPDGAARSLRARPERPEGHAPRHDSGGDRAGAADTEGARRGRHGQRALNTKGSMQASRIATKASSGGSGGEGRRYGHESARRRAAPEHGAPSALGQSEGFERAPERERASLQRLRIALKATRACGRPLDAAVARRPPRRTSFEDQPRPAEPAPRESRTSQPASSDDFGSGVFEVKHRSGRPYGGSPSRAPPPPPACGLTTPVFRRRALNSATSAARPELLPDLQVQHARASRLRARAPISQGAHGGKVHDG